jgi:hypothetical protein
VQKGKGAGEAAVGAVRQTRGKSLGPFVSITSAPLANAIRHFASFRTRLRAEAPPSSYEFSTGSSAGYSPRTGKPRGRVSPPPPSLRSLTNAKEHQVGESPCQTCSGRITTKTHILGETVHRD